MAAAVVDSEEAFWRTLREGDHAVRGVLEVERCWVHVMCPQMVCARGGLTVEGQENQRRINHATLRPWAIVHGFQPETKHHEFGKK